MKKYFLIFMSLFMLASCSGELGDDRLTSISGAIRDVTDNIPKIQKILALGDSLTAGYGVEENNNDPNKLSELLEDEGYNYEVINAGVSGDTSGDLLERAGLYLDQDPDIVLLIIGGNDGLQGKSVDVMKENILEIIDMFDDGERKIVVGGMEIPINLGLSYSRDFNAVYKAISQERKDIYFHAEFLEGVGGYARYNISDRIHPNSDGYDIIVKNLYNFLEDENIITK